MKTKYTNNVYIVMPAYNEAANIEAVVEAWYPCIEDKGEGSKLVVADSGSTDQTHAILLKMQEKYKKIDILSKTGKGHGEKLMALYDYAIREGADYIFQTDSDGQTDATEFESFWELREEYDAILGMRHKRGDGIFRTFVEKILCCILKLIFDIRVSDANAPFRLMKANLVEKYLYKLPMDYNLPNVMMTTFFKYYEEKMIFKSITFKSRQGGNNSINVIKIIKTGWKALYDFEEFRKEMEALEV